MTSQYIRNGVGVTDPVLADSGAQLRSEPRTGRDKHPFPAVAGRGQSATNRSARPRARHWARRRGKNPTRLQNGAKNTAAQSGCSQTISASRKYDAWGNVRSSTGTWNGPFGHAGGFGYQSSDRSGLQLLGHRYYDPETGCFLTRDPNKDGNNWHAYGGGINNPIASVDPTGLYILVVYGDNEGVPGARIGFEAVRPRIGEIKDGSKMNKAQLMEALIFATEFFFYGHGTESGSLCLQNNERLTQADILTVVLLRIIMGQPLMTSVALYACCSSAKADYVNQWLEITKKLIGYPDVTASRWPPKINRPSTYTEPINHDPGGAKKKKESGKKIKGKP